MTVKTKARTFETAYRSLEALVSEIETRTLGLDEGIAKFEQGLELAQFCKERLAVAENKVVAIKKKFADSFDMDAPDDDDGTGRTGVGVDEEENEDDLNIKEVGDEETLPGETDDGG